MSGNRKWITAAAAAGIVALAALTGCGGDERKSMAAPQQAQHEHGHGHGEPTPTPGADAGHQHHGAPQEEHPASHGASPTSHSAMGHGAGQHAAGHAPGHGASQHAGHGSLAGEPAAGGHDHTGHSQQPAATGHEHAGHSASGGKTPSRPVADLPAEPASILRPDPLDAPAATSVVDTQRSAEMSGGQGEHGSHEAGTYRHVDAGREAPDAEPQHHDHNATLYVCPMHPEVTSKTPGTCPKCGMTLVERREE